MPTFSIIIPVYNSASFLPLMLDSIQKQTYPSYEVIMVDDGSTDNSFTILGQYSQNDERFICYKKENSGPSATRNYALEKAVGKYICFFDADDYVGENFLEDMHSVIEKENPDLINTGFYSEVHIEFPNNIAADSITIPSMFYKSIDEIKFDFVKMWDTHMLYNVWNKVYKKQIIDTYHIQFPLYNWGEDIAFNREYLLHIKNLYQDERCYYHYVRERGTSLTKQYRKNLFETRKKEFDEFNQYFEKFGLNQNEYQEFSYRRHMERIVGCTENLFHSDLSFSRKYSEIRKYIKDPLTRKAIKGMKPQSRKMKILLIPYRIHSALLVFIMGKLLSVVKQKNPKVFNQLKNRR